jgi:predicted ATPase/DNA-binding winged helix-turn-helix (wHTH) protein
MLLTRGQVKLDKRTLDKRTTDSELPARGIYELGTWEVDLARHELRARGTPIPLGSRALDIIEILIKAAGELVTKDEFMERAWPGVIVSENTLSVHISAIRKALGTDRDLLKTDLGRGYRLLGAWKIREIDPAGQEVEPSPKGTAPPESFQSNLPTAASGLIGRIDALQRLENLLSAYRVVTLTGAGGIGKTTLAIEASRRLFSTLQGDLCFIELAALLDPGLVASVVAGVLDLRLNDDEITANSVAKAIGSKKLLLLLDNCEHVIDAAAELAETLVRRCPAVTILATSRELLRIEGEKVFHVPTLDVPPEGQEAPDDILRHSAVQLFTVRMQALNPRFSPHDDNLSAIVSICRHLDGIPLAIELAAARAATLGLQFVAEAMDDRFTLLTGGRRTALPRQQTLRATLDWSYDLLTDAERSTLRRLSVFAGDFSLSAAEGIAQGSGLASADVTECLASLVTKSLVTAEHVVPSPRYRMLETTRAYIQRKRDAAEELDACRRRHADYHLTLLQEGAAEREADGGVRPSRQTRVLVDDVSAALEWAFSPRGDTTVGIALTIAAIPLWIRTSSLQECRRRVQQAIASLGEATTSESRNELRLLIALATAMQNGVGPGPETTTLWRRAHVLAERLGDQDFQLRTLWGLWIDCRNAGTHRQAVQIANRFRDLAALRNTTDDMLVAERMMGMSCLISGDLRDARCHVERMLANYTETSLTPHMVRFHFEQRAGATFLLALIEWLQGFPGPARDMIDNGVDEVIRTGHALQISVLLAQFACPVAYLLGDVARLEAFVSRLLDYTDRHGLAAWSARGRCWQALLRIREGEVTAGMATLNRALQEFPGRGHAFQHVWFLGELASAQVDAGKQDEAERSIDLALKQADTSGEEWCVPELLRIRGNVFRSKAMPTEAEAAFARSISLSQRQEARSWELRAATSLAGLWCEAGRRLEAVALLAPVFSGFDATFETEDLRHARTVLETAA